MPSEEVRPCRGDVFLALTLWRILGLDELLERELPEGREKVPWHLTACVLGVARFVEPSSELHVEDTWYLRTALPELPGISVDEVEEHRLCRTLDRALPLKGKIESHLKERIGELFSPDFDILLYDVTSTYFEGEAKRNPQAARGHSRDHRRDCKQVCIGLAVTTDGFPLGYEVFAGNRNDVTTLEEIVEAMEAKYGRANRVWVARLRRKAWRFKSVRQSLKKLWSKNLAKGLTFLDDSFLPATSNAVDRTNRRHRKMQKTVYRVRTARGARTVIEELARIKAADVVLPTTAGRDVRLACVTRPDKAQAAIIERLGIELPERLGRPRWVPVPTEAEM